MIHFKAIETLFHNMSIYPEDDGGDCDGLPVDTLHSGQSRNADDGEWSPSFVALAIAGNTYKSLLFHSYSKFWHSLVIKCAKKTIRFTESILTEFEPVDEIEAL